MEGCARENESDGILRWPIRLELADVYQTRQAKVKLDMGKTSLMLQVRQH
jgi:hypothetical protein